MEKSVVECGKIGFNSTGIRQVIDLQEVLLNKYVEILNKPEHQNLLRAINNKDNKLSNIHLGFVPEHYESAEHIVKQNKKYPTKPAQKTNSRTSLFSGAV